MSSATSKSGWQAPEETEPRPDVIAGDEVFFNHPQGHMSGTVLACGAHGATLRCAAGVTHKIKWPHILGLKKRAAQHYEVHEAGEDGHLIRDQNGATRYMAVPNEAREDPLVAKAAPGGSGFVGGPGLTKKVIVEKTGKKNTHWVKTSKDQPKGRKKAAPKPAAKPHPAAAKTGERVRFKAGDFAGEGTVVGKPGPRGAHIKDKSGRVHKVKWDELVTKPDYAAREEGETDKAYAKRAVDTQPSPKHLPEQHDRYFHTEGSTKVSIENLHSTKSEEENAQGGDNSPKRMEAAYHGVLAKRPPITVAPHPDKPGHFKVLDGNGTYTGAKKSGWTHMPVTVVREAEYKAKELAKKVIDPNDKEFKSLPSKARQPTGDRDELFKLSAVGLEQLKKWLDEGVGVASKSGFKTMSSGMQDVSAAEYQAPGKMLFIAGLKHASEKGMARTIQKVEDDYGGDWTKLSDLVRCTLAVDDLDEMADTMVELRRSGMKIAQVPKNKFLTPTDMGYSDINLIVTMGNGVQAEVQLNVKDMLVAKNEAHPHYEITRKLRGKYEVKDKPALPIEKWSPEDQKAFVEAQDEQKRIYGTAWLAHIEKHYGSKSNMIKSLRRVLIFSRR